MLNCLSIYLLLPLLIAATVDEGPTPISQIIINNQIIYSEPSPYTSSLPLSSSPLNGVIVRSPSDITGCMPYSKPTAVTTGANFIMLVNRGNCTFTEKMLNALNAGAHAIIISNVLPSLYNTTLNVLLDGCSVDCNAGSASVSSFNNDDLYVNAFSSSSCATNPSCSSKMCALTYPVSVNNNFDICCIVDKYTDMSINITGPSIPSLFVNLEGGNSIWATVSSSSSPPSISISNRPTSFDPTPLYLWLIGFIVVGLACYRSAKDERKRLTQGNILDENRTHAHEEEVPEVLDITAWQAVGFLLLSSCALVGLYYLLMAGPQTVIKVIIVFFCLGSLQSLVFILFRPSIAFCFPISIKKDIMVPLFGSTTYAQLISVCLATIIVVVWFFERHSESAWFIQNIFSACLVCMFLLTIRLSSVRVAAILLILMFFYDIFMVFLSPLIFQQSVMVEVATAGGATSSSSTSPTGMSTCDRTLEERLPMLFLVPRGDWRGGYGMLGLGDLVVPGLLLAFSLRFDTMTQKKCTNGYFMWLWIGYGVGLMCAFLANSLGLTINGVKGQPALLYLVPCTLGPFTALAYYRGDLKYLWRGSKKDRSFNEGGGDLSVNYLLESALSPPSSINQVTSTHLSPTKENNGGGSNTPYKLSSDINL